MARKAAGEKKEKRNQLLQGYHGAIDDGYRAVGVVERVGVKGLRADVHKEKM